MKNIKYILCLFTILLIMVIVSSDLEVDISKYRFDNKRYETPQIYKIIIVGDSRMEFIENDSQNLKIPNNFIFDAKSGAKINWFFEQGIPELNKLLLDQEKNKYIVVFNLGVNDLNSNESVENIAEEYFNIYKKIITSYKNVAFRFLSVNPVDEEKYNVYVIGNNLTNQKIKTFNKYFIERMKSENLSNVKFCDSYNNLEFYLPDGIHYDFETNKKIISYIIENCI